MGRKRSVCRLASQTQLLTVCLTPPTPTLPVLSNVSSRTECETTEIKGASRLWTTPIPPNPRIKVWFVPGPVLLSRLQTSCTSSSESEVRQMEVTHGSRRPTQYPPSGKALASAVRQSSFFPGLQFHEWWNLLSGENWFLLTVSNPAMTVSVHSTGWGTGALVLQLTCWVTWGRLLHLSKPLLLPLPSYLVVWRLSETMNVKSVALGLHGITAE